MTKSLTQEQRLKALCRILSARIRIRTEKSVNGVTTKYYIEGDRIVLEKAGNEERAFWYDGNGQAAAFVIYDSTGMYTYYYIRNGQGDVIGVFDANGTIVARYTYDSWGNLLKITDGSGNDKTNDTTFVEYKNPLRYRGYYYDSETKLYYLQSRYYNPEWGRFISADGIIGANGDLIANNLFAYCSNNPVMLVDPSGYIAVVDDAVWAILIYEAAKFAFGAAVSLAAIIGAAAAGQAIGKKYYSSNPGTDGSSALQRPKDPFKPELKLYKGNKKIPSHL